MKDDAEGADGTAEGGWFATPDRMSVAPQPVAALDMVEVARLRASIEVYERELLASVDPRRRATLAHEIGRIHEDVFGDEREATRHYQRAFRYDPTHRPTLAAVRRLFARAGHWGMVARLLDAELKATTGPVDRSRLLCEKGELHLQQFGRPDSAARAFQGALALSGPSARALHGLAQASALEGTPQVAADSLLGLADLSGAGAAPALCLEAALTLRAVDRARANALFQLPGGAAAAGVTGWALAARQGLDATSPVQDLSSDAAGLGEEGALRAPPGLLLALAGSAAAPGAALRWARAAVAQAPSSAEAWERVAELEAARGDLAAAASALAAAAEAPATARERVDRLWRLAELRLGELGDTDGAADALEQLLTIEPDWSPAVARLERLLTSQGDWRRLAAVMAARLDGARETAPAEAWLRLGLLLAGRLEAPGRAIPALRTALALDPELADARRALGRCLEAIGDWGGAADLLEAEASQSEDEDTWIHRLTRAAEIRAERLQDPEGAVRTCRQLLGRVSEHLPTLQRLGRLLSGLGRFAELLDVNDLELDLIRDRDRVLGLLLRSAEISDTALGDTERAVAYLERALALAPQHGPVLDALAEVHQRAGAWSALVALFRRQAAASADPRSRVAMLFRVGELLRDRLDDEVGAMAAFEEALAAAGDHLPTLQSLRGLYRAQGAAPREATLLRREVDLLESAEARAVALHRLATLRAGPLEDPAGALAAWQEALRQVPDHRGALLGLLAAHERAGAIEAAVAVRATLARTAATETEALVHRAELVRLTRDDPRFRAETVAACEAAVVSRPSELWAWFTLERVALAEEDLSALERIYGGLAEALDGPLAVEMRARRGRLRAGPLDDPEGAQADFRAILAAEPGHAEALEHLERVAVRTGDVALLAMVLAPRLAVATSDREQVMVLQRAGDALWRAGRLTDAVRCFEAVRALDADSIVALRALSALYGQLGEADAAVRLTEAEGRTAHDPRHAVALLLAAGSQREDTVRDADGALADYRAALARDPYDDEVLERVRRLCMRTGRLAAWEEVLARVGPLRGAAGTPLRLERVELLARRLGDLAGALTALVELARDRKDVGLWQRAGDLATEAEDWDVAAQAYGEVFALSQDADLRRAVVLRVAAVHRDKRHDAPAALAWLRRTTAEAPEPRALRRLAEVADEVAWAALGGRPDVGAPWRPWSDAPAAVAEAREAWRALLGDSAGGDGQAPAGGPPARASRGAALGDAGSGDAAVVSEARLRLVTWAPDVATAWATLEAVDPGAVDPDRIWAAAVALAPSLGGDNRLLDLAERLVPLVGGARGKALRRQAVEVFLATGGAAPTLLPMLERLLGADPDDEALRRLHLEALAGCTQPDRVVAAHRWILSRNPFDAEVLRGLRRASERAGATDRAFELARLLTGLDCARAEDRQVIEEWQSQTRRWPTRPLDRIDRRLVWGGGLEANLAAVLGRLGAAVPAVARPVVPLEAEVPAALAEQVERIGALLGCAVGRVAFAALPLAMVRQVDGVIHLSPELAHLAAGEQSFLIGAGLELVARGLDWVVDLLPETLPTVLAALARSAAAPGAVSKAATGSASRVDGVLAEPKAEVGKAGEVLAADVDPAEVAATVLRLEPAIRPVWAAVADDLDSLAALLPQANPHRMVERMGQAARRVGLLTAGGVLPAVRALRRAAATGKDPAAPEATPGLPDVVRWLLGDPYYALRSRLGLAPEGPR